MCIAHSRPPFLPGLPDSQERTREERVSRFQKIKTLVQQNCQNSGGRERTEVCCQTVGSQEFTRAAPDADHVFCLLFEPSSRPAHFGGTLSTRSGVKGARTSSRQSMATAAATAPLEPLVVQMPPGRGRGAGAGARVTQSASKGRRPVAMAVAATAAASAAATIRRAGDADRAKHAQHSTGDGCQADNLSTILAANYLAKSAQKLQLLHSSFADHLSPRCPTSSLLLSVLCLCYVCLSKICTLLPARPHIPKVSSRNI